MIPIAGTGLGLLLSGHPDRGGVGGYGMAVTEDALLASLIGAVWPVADKSRRTDE